MKIKIITFLLLFSWSIETLAKTVVTIAGYGGNDVIAMTALINEVLADELEALNIEINYIAIESDYPKFILNSLSSGKAPDAFYVNADVAESWVQTEKLVPLPNDVVSEARHVDAALRSIYTFNDNLYAIPKDFNALALAYNKDIFDDAEVAYPSENDDWFDLKSKLSSVVNNIGDEGVTGLCISADYNRFAPFALSTGWNPFDEDMRTVLDKRFVNAFQFYTSLLTDGLAELPADVGQTWGGGCFAIEKTAITIEGSWIAGYLRDRSPNLLYGSTSIPVDPVTGGSGNLLFTAGWAVNVDSKVKEQAFKVIQLLTNLNAQEYILQSGLAIPSDKRLGNASYLTNTESHNLLAKTIYEATNADHLQSFVFGKYGSNWMEPIQIALSSVFLGELSVEQAVKEAQSKYDQMYLAYYGESD